ncbi:MAG: hypothetical protein QXL25_04575 [Candidatus Bathyarchaeia archaeon]
MIVHLTKNIHPEPYDVFTELFSDIFFQSSQHTSRSYFSDIRQSCIPQCRLRLLGRLACELDKVYLIAKAQYILATPRRFSKLGQLKLESGGAYRH